MFPVTWDRAVFVIRFISPLTTGVKQFSLSMTENRSTKKVPKIPRDKQKPSDDFNFSEDLHVVS